MRILIGLIREAWELLLSDYKRGRVILRDERDLGRSLTDICNRLMKEKDIAPLIANQERRLGRRVDLRLGPYSEPLLVQLKLYHDKADWKETRTMRNTVESDLRFAKGRDNVYVGIIDVIPSSSRPPIPFRFQWKTFEIDKKVFHRWYANINPPTSPPRERVQRALLASGLEI